jgi:hypothetical protein
MQVVHVLTLGAALPAVVHDRVLTGLEDSLLSSGATRIWIEPDQPGLAVVAEFAELPSYSRASTSDRGSSFDPSLQGPV